MSPENTSISFVLGQDRLTTVRYADPARLSGTLVEQTKRQCTSPCE